MLAIFFYTVIPLQAKPLPKAFGWIVYRVAHCLHTERTCKKVVNHQMKLSVWHSYKATCEKVHEWTLQAVELCGVA